MITFAAQDGILHSIRYHLKHHKMPSWAVKQRELWVIGKRVSGV